MRPEGKKSLPERGKFTLSPDQKGIETPRIVSASDPSSFTLSPDQKGIETIVVVVLSRCGFTLSPDQKGIETPRTKTFPLTPIVHTEPRSKGD